MDLKTIRRAGVPLVSIETSDPALTIASARRSLNGKADLVAVMQWDICNGLTGLNAPGRTTTQEIAPNGAIDTGNPTECLRLLADKAPDGTLVFFHSAHAIVGNADTAQAVWNLRDIFKGKGATLVLLSPALKLPDLLKNDVVSISDPLPDESALRDIIESISADAGLEPIGKNEGTRIVDALLGLSAFAAEQCLAMSISPTGIDLGALWERKRMMIEQTPGLSVWRGGESFADVGGCSNVKSFCSRIMAGNRAPRAIAFIDEIEKSITGSGDTSGVSQDYLGALLQFMQDKQSTGMIFIGPPGAAKSAIAKAAGTEGNTPTIQMDLGGMKGSLVGQSEQQLRQALKVVDAVSQGRTLFIATCNSFGNLPPELKRRFTLGTFFFDLPNQEERTAIWKIYLARYDLMEPTPNDAGWTGAEIRQCCDIASRMKCSLTEAASFIVPVSRSAADQIETLRKQASGKFCSASIPGVYQHNPQATAPSGRKFGE